MKLHREGFGIMLVASLIALILSFLNFLAFSHEKKIIIPLLLELLIVTFFLVIAQFFRIPKRICQFGENDIVCPADGKIVVLEETNESEYFKDKRIQISIFMSPLNVHANYFPISGITKFMKYHPGLFLVAWHPKSSTDNERTTIVVEQKNGTEVLFRQIAGAVARRICYYTEIGLNAKQGEEFGFIKFGSRIDVFLPIGTTINVKIGDKVKAKLTRLGTFN